MKMLIQFELFLPNQNFKKFWGNKLSQIFSSYTQALALTKYYSFPESNMET